MTTSTAQKSFIKRHSDSISAFVAALLVTAGVVGVAYQIQQRYTLATFATLADRQAESLKANVENDLKFIGAGANFYHSIDSSYWSAFPVYAEQVINSSHSLIGLQWMQRVEREDLDAHIAKMRQTYPDYQIFTVPKDQPQTFGYILENNTPVYVATDIYPRTQANLSLLGFYFSRKRFDLIFDDISTHKRANVSDKVRLLQDGYDKSIPKSGLLVYHPVFDSENKNLLGVVTGVIRSTVYFEELITKTATELEMSVRVEDLGFDASDDPFLFQSENWDRISGKVISRTIQLPNRQWRIDFKLSDAVSAWERSILTGTTIAGLLIAFLISYIVNLQSREKERLAEMLDIKTVELKRMAELDPLTQLLNRRVFNDNLLNQINSGKPFSLVGFDIDHFKVINDKYGHLAGDEALLHVTRLVNANLNAGDRFYRAGGDEFCILSTVTDTEELEAYLEKLRGIVASSSFDYEEASIICTLSIGAVVHHDEDPENLYHKMDAQLYLSKENGRNTVSIGD
ncbi:sensor domain-containing diguanylate cyclase [Vibrio parahaemolyticus]|uniref:sensor domain-containing diguanylate cyclase n=1 Tax=Vibrio parahaemolyticus TaxID=670 RepID=UPI00111F14D1|nr:sensor domain-containing diguanylate cyclase [Vibrio parahaemolyticus]EIO4080361.1 sensor domain-containing diguanylate cyclase [Vibrio parahaemolyticus]EJE4207692.1 sensor domain-containing diguanylate cyclase [Vibrio parahaemolyticus]MBO0157688.1 sensor domain-containing diguanylate cyclase [Vibrio parahaemolyticus]MBO0171257.1 sensor domain-containing diguanylate cyclase [Vibrio parahaemolyticus]MDF4610877.1 sensor domain-containing diguanylate cyclase [Vibrio parahaemolyticus]